jgi:hypothetical protein
MYRQTFYHSPLVAGEDAFFLSLPTLEDMVSLQNGRNKGGPGESRNCDCQQQGGPDTSTVGFGAA